MMIKLKTYIKVADYLFILIRILFSYLHAQIIKPDVIKKYKKI
jgi:hypothetical protein